MKPLDLMRKSHSAVRVELVAAPDTPSCSASIVRCAFAAIHWGMSRLLHLNRRHLIGWTFVMKAIDSAAWSSDNQ
jgi:hypothetical protein